MLLYLFNLILYSYFSYNPFSSLVLSRAVVVEVLIVLRGEMNHAASIRYTVHVKSMSLFVPSASFPRTVCTNARSVTRPVTPVSRSDLTYKPQEANNCSL